MLLLYQFEWENVKDRVTIWKMTVQARKFCLLVKFKLSLGRGKVLFRMQDRKQWSTCVSRELSIELWWRKGKFLTVVLHSVKSSWGLSRCRVSKDLWLAEEAWIQWVSSGECKTEMAHQHFCFRTISFGEWKATSCTLLLQESKMVPLYYGLSWLLVSTKATQEIPQALTGTWLWFPRREAHILLKHCRKIK